MGVGHNIYQIKPQGISVSSIAWRETLTLLLFHGFVRFELYLENLNYTLHYCLENALVWEVI